MAKAIKKAAPKKKVTPAKTEDRLAVTGSFMNIMQAAMKDASKKDKKK